MALDKQQLEKKLSEILNDCVDTCADSVLCHDSDKYLTGGKWEGKGPNNYYRDQLKHLIDEYAEDEKRQLQIDDRLVMLGWMKANQDNLKVSEIIGTLQAQVKDLETEQRRRAGIGEK